MKKTIPFFVIIGLLLTLTVLSQRMVDGIFCTLEDQLFAAESMLQQDDFNAALAAVSNCIDSYDTQEKFLIYFMPSETLHLFEASVYGMRCYIAEQNRTEALAEAARAHAQLNAVWAMYFRVV